MLVQTQQDAPLEYCYLPPASAASSGDRFERAEHILNLYNPFLSSPSSPSSLLLFWGAQETQMWQSGTPYISSLGYIIP